jgi:hypothetical protein
MGIPKSKCDPEVFPSDQAEHIALPDHLEHVWTTRDQNITCDPEVI